MDLRTQAYCDCKPAARKFLQMNGDQNAHIFGTVAEMMHAVATGADCLCMRHGSCKVTASQPEGDVFVCGGFPCSPFSNQRCGRHLAGRPSSALGSRMENKNRGRTTTLLHCYT